MSRLILCACLVCICCAACQGASTPASTTGAPAEPGDQIEWQGLLACADCDGIQTGLVLERGGDRRRYTLTETYVTGSGSARFIEHGAWQQNHDLLRLRGDDASVRVYALLPDGRLQARDSHGNRLSAATSQDLVPVGFSSSD